MRDLILRHAARSDHSLHHHVAWIERHGTIITIATNRGWRHAEERAIRLTPPHLLRGATLRSFRVRKNGLFGNARPCRDRQDGRPSCSELIRLSGIKLVIYSDENGELARERVDV